MHKVQGGRVLPCAYSNTQGAGPWMVEAAETPGDSDWAPLSWEVKVPLLGQAGVGALFPQQGFPLAHGL